MFAGDVAASPELEDGRDSCQKPTRPPLDQRRVRGRRICVTARQPSCVHGRRTKPPCIRHRRASMSPLLCRRASACATAPPLVSLCVRRRSTGRRASVAARQAAVRPYRRVHTAAQKAVRPSPLARPLCVRVAASAPRRAEGIASAEESKCAALWRRGTSASHSSVAVRPAPRGSHPATLRPLVA
jgi:hypothetical protein